MTTYPIPHFEGVAIGLDRVPQEFELFPDAETISLGAYDAEIRLIGTRRRYKIELMLSEIAIEHGSPISVWTFTKTAANNISAHAKSGGQFQITVGTLTFEARISDDNYAAFYR